MFTLSFLIPHTFSSIGINDALGEMILYDVASNFLTFLAKRTSIKGKLVLHTLT